MANKYSKDLRSLASYSGFKPLISKMLVDAADELDKLTPEDESVPTTPITLYYIRVHVAEEDGYAIVPMTLEQKAVVDAALSVDFVSGGGYCGGVFFSDRGYLTYDEALAAIHDGSWSD